MAAGDKKVELGELGDPQHQATERNRKKLADQQESKDWKRVLGTPEGKRVVGWFLDQCHLHQPSYSMTSSTLTALREGERNVGLRLLHQLGRVCPDEWKKIVIAQMEGSIKTQREHDDRLRLVDDEHLDDEEPEDE